MSQAQLKPASTGQDNTVDHTNVHADPTQIPLSPLNRQTVIDYGVKINQINGVDKAEFAETPEYSSLEIHVSINEEMNCKDDFCSTIINSLNTDTLELATEGITIGAQREIPPNEIDSAIKLVEHPVKHPLDYCLSKAGLSNCANKEWSPNDSNISFSANIVEWDQTTPVKLSFRNVKRKKLVKFKQLIKDVAPPSTPADYILQIDEHIADTTDGQSTHKDTKQTVSYELTYTNTENRQIENRDVVIVQGDASELSSNGKSSENKGSNITQKISQTNHTEKFQLTVTSPPYLDAVDYESYEGTHTVDYTGKDDTHDVENKIEAWRDTQSEIFSGVYSATKEGGFCAVIIGTTKCDGQFVDLPAEFSQMMTTELDWKLQEKITWHKITGGNSNFGTTIQHNYPKYYQANQLTEQILVFRKGEHGRRNRKEEEIQLNDFVKSEVANNIWNIPPTPHNTIEHPCPYPAEIPHRLISLYTWEGEAVLDPMSGSGTTVKVAKALNRKSLGIEIEPKFVRESRKRVFTEEYNRNPQKKMEAKDVPPENATILENNTSNKQKNLSKFKDN